MLYHGVLFPSPYIPELSGLAKTLYIGLLSQPYVKPYTTRRRRVYSGKRISLELIELEVAGRKYVKEVVLHRGAVVIVPRLANDKFLVLKQYRVAVNDWVIEFPAGTLEEGEKPEECALRELEEETGFRANRITFLGAFYASPGYTSEKLYAYLAEDLVRTEARREPTEFIETLELSLRELLSVIAEGKIGDGKTLASILLYLEKTSKKD